MATNATKTTVKPPQTLHDFPDELVQHVVDYIDKDDLASFRTLRLICRRMHHVATFCAFNSFMTDTRKSKIDSSIKIVENQAALMPLGRGIEDVWLRFPGSHYVENRISLFRADVDVTAELERLTLTMERRSLRAKRTAEHERVDISRLLAQFPNMQTLTLQYLNQISLLGKLPLPALRAATTMSRCNLTALLLWDCKISSGDLATLLSIFHNIKKLEIKETDFTDSWVQGLCQVRVRATALLHLCLEMNDLSLNARCFVTESEEQADQLQELSGSWILHCIHLSNTKAEAIGAVAIDFLLEKILTGWIGEKELEKVCVEMQE